MNDSKVIKGKVIDGIACTTGSRIIDIRGFFDVPEGIGNTIESQQVDENQGKSAEEYISANTSLEGYDTVEANMTTECSNEAVSDDEYKYECEDKAENSDVPVFKKTAIVSLNRESIEKIKKQKKAQGARKNETKATRFFLLRIMVAISRFLTLKTILLHQRFERVVRKMENGGVDFETRFSEKELFYLGISLDRTIKKPSDVLLYFPLISMRLAARLLDIRKNHLEAYRKIYEKKGR